MSKDAYTWITTRDGSPTLWNNALGEAFRNTRVVFTESWETFVLPTLHFALKHPELRPLQVGEFGLGPGTNWRLLTLAAHWLGISIEYSAIEQDLESFQLGTEKWQETESFHQILNFLELKLLKNHFILHEKPLLETLKWEILKPQIFQDLVTFDASLKKVNVWFHDPFGFEVNPEGYSMETLRTLRSHWQSPCLGLSYSCHSNFQGNLKSLGCTLQRMEYESSLKRERLEFSIC